jgi:2-polyprenyl-3-methyl-5-hydroxy-6-metoxy-1,4-benzoquinol methylase
MSQSYSILAPVYDEIGLSSFAQQIVPMMLEHAQRNDWLGRQITEIGCGTGEGILTLANSNFTLTGVDISLEMLEVAESKANSVRWVQEDILAMSDAIGEQDMILAVNVLNEFSNVRELQTVFTAINERLRSKRIFMFDMYTIAGLTKRGTQGNQMIHDEHGVTVFVSNEYDYERQSSTRNHITFLRDPEAGGWNRMDTSRTLRAFPLQAIAALLQRSNFSNVSVLNTQFSSVENPSSVDRVIFVATK